MNYGQPNGALVSTVSIINALDEATREKVLAELPEEIKRRLVAEQDVIKRRLVAEQHAASILAAAGLNPNAAQQLLASNFLNLSAPENVVGQPINFLKVPGAGLGHTIQKASPASAGHNVGMKTPRASNNNYVNPLGHHMTTRLTGGGINDVGFKHTAVNNAEVQGGMGGHNNGMRISGRIQNQSKNAWPIGTGIALNPGPNGCQAGTSQTLNLRATMALNTGPMTSARLGVPSPTYLQMSHIQHMAHMTQMSQMNQMHQVNSGANPIAQMNQMNQMAHMAHMAQMNQLNHMAQMNQLNPMNQLNQRNQMTQVNHSHGNPMQFINSPRFPSMPGCSSPGISGHPVRQKSICSTYLDDFKQGYPSKGLPVVSNRWWGSAEQDKVPEKNTKNPSAEGLQINESGEAEGSADSSAMVVSSREGKAKGQKEMMKFCNKVTRSRGRAALCGRRALRLRVTKGYGEQKLGDKDADLLRFIFGSSLPREWLPALPASA